MSIYVGKFESLQVSFVIPLFSKIDLTKWVIGLRQKVTFAFSGLRAVC